MSSTQASLSISRRRAAERDVVAMLRRAEVPLQHPVPRFAPPPASHQCADGKAKGVSFSGNFSLGNSVWTQSRIFFPFSTFSANQT